MNAYKCWHRPAFGRDESTFKFSAQVSKGPQCSIQQSFCLRGAVARRRNASIPLYSNSSSSSKSEENTEELGKGIKLARRTLQVTFTCNKCGERTARLVNPLAWEKGLVFLQCGGCEVWHKLKDNENLIDEITFQD